MHLAAMAYNLKKHLKFTQKLIKSSARALVFLCHGIKALQNLMDAFV